MVQAVLQVSSPQHALAESIKSNFGMLVSAQTERRNLRESLNDVYLSDKEFRKVQLELESLSDRRKELKKIFKDSNSDVQQLLGKINAASRQIRSLKRVISGYLEQYSKDTQMQLFEGLKIDKNYQLKLK